MTDDKKPTLRREPCDPQPDPLRVAGALAPEILLELAARERALRVWSRRVFLGSTIAGTLGCAFGLAACATKGQGAANLNELPLGQWQEPPAPLPRAVVAHSDPAPEQTPASATKTKPVAPKPAAATPTSEAALPWAKPRFLWAKGAPIRAELNPMLPVTCVTVHHDGLEELIWTARTEDVAARMEHYRVGHLGRGWADIGYHLAIDRGGVLWQGRSIRWQGAHVQFHNEGNIGVLVMGNFDLQRPTAAQLVTLKKVLVDLRSTYGIKRGRVYTHKEWQDAQTACPGSNLQPRVEKLRTAIGA